MVQTPILYSFRRCPYCIRAHMALDYAQLKIILRPVVLSNLPDEALAVSPHASVPSLVISAQEYMDESWDIVKWAVLQNDPQNWLGHNDVYLKQAEMLIETNDFSFKQDLDHYKYAERHPEQPMEYYRQRCEEFIVELNEMLELNNFLLASHITIADIGIFPFIRQFAMVDSRWFDHATCPALQRWLKHMQETPWFRSAFRKHVLWHSGSKDIILQ